MNTRRIVWAALGALVITGAAAPMATAGAKQDRERCGYEERDRCDDRGRYRDHYVSDRYDRYDRNDRYVSDRYDDCDHGDRGARRRVDYRRPARQYECDECGRDFASSYALNYHRHHSDCD